MMLWPHVTVQDGTGVLPRRASAVLLRPEMDDKVAERTNDATPEHDNDDDRPADRKQYLDQRSLEFQLGSSLRSRDAGSVGWS
jgi:hypothetical protein